MGINSAGVLIQFGTYQYNSTKLHTVDFPIVFRTGSPMAWKNNHSSSSAQGGIRAFCIWSIGLDSFITYNNKDYGTQFDWLAIGII